MSTTTQASVRVPNYTDAMVNQMVGEYTANPSLDTVQALSTAMGKNTRSIIAKLVREGVYQAAPRVTKSGAPIVRKSNLVEQIESYFLGASLPSLVKASKADLQKMVDAMESKGLQAVNKFSEEELDWYTILHGMMMEGMSKTEALAAMTIMDCPINTVRKLLESMNAKS